MFPICASWVVVANVRAPAGHREISDVEYLVCRRCVISLASPLDSRIRVPAQACVTYTDGFVLPGSIPGMGQTVLPDDLEEAAIEQVAYWFQNRDKLGLVRIWPHQGTFEHFAQLDLLLNVKAVLKRYERWMC